MIHPDSLDPNKVYKVWHTLEQGGRQLGQHSTDLQVDEGVIYAALSGK
jgi:hypothetical protein